MTNKKAPALKLTVALCKALALAMDVQWPEYDKETSKLMQAMADYVTKYGE